MPINWTQLETTALADCELAAKGTTPPLTPTEHAKLQTVLELLNKLNLLAFMTEPKAAAMTRQGLDRLVKKVKG